MSDRPIRGLRAEMDIYDDTPLNKDGGEAVKEIISRLQDGNVLDNNDIIILFALRYALERRGTAAGIIIDFIGDNIDYIGNKFLNKCVETIDDAYTFGKLDVDRFEDNNWLYLRNAVKEEIKFRENHR